MNRTLLLAASCVAAIGASSLAYADSDFAAVHGRADSFTPHVLSSEDVRLYRSIFENERSGNFKTARQEIADLSDKSLMGYAEAEHFLSPRGKKTSVKILAEWLVKYDELPIAPKVRELAEQHNRHHKVALAAIPEVRARGGWGYESSDNVPDAPLVSDAARVAQSQIDADVKIDQPAQAEAVLQNLVAAGGTPPSDVARLAHHVAASYLAEGMDSEASRVATSVSSPDRDAEPLLDWDAGLAAYRLANFTDAASRFESLAQSGVASGWARSAAAFWAARAYLQAGEPLHVVSLLNAAAREQPTFYGMLAERLLGHENQTQFSEPMLDSASFDSMIQNSATHRAVALWQVGETDYVQPEMLRAFANIPASQISAFAALAHRMDLPDLELRASETQAAHGVLLSGLFPMPRYTPPGGYSVDPCLVLAFARTESRFQARAVSKTGARGVMQIMPGTAHDEDTAASRSQLNNPAYSLGLGQKYLQELLDQVNGNLFQLAAAYNAGPGSLTRWIGTHPAIADDPLLFIESIPVPETRKYIKRVMTFYWMYAQRAGQQSPSLQETAEGKWPIYHHQAAQGSNPPTGIGNALISDANTPH
ncbi:MAG: lytic transglycosylase domain-containing protein [Rhizomicrobium sp.]